MQLILPKLAYIVILWPLGVVTRKIHSYICKLINHLQSMVNLYHVVNILVVTYRSFTRKFFTLNTIHHIFMILYKRPWMAITYTACIYYVNWNIFTVVTIGGICSNHRILFLVEICWINLLLGKHHRIALHNIHRYKSIRITKPA